MAMPAPAVLDAAQEAGLRYTSDERPGDRRLRRGRGFRYVDPDGRPITDADELARIRALAIPPAWTDVWICTDRRGHLQATGRDARGRKQYRYHVRFQQARDEDKYGRMLDFAKALPKIRARVHADLGAHGLTREKVIATIVSLLEQTLIRVGNEEYARDNASYGLTTLRERHVLVAGSRVRFRFRGKSGKEHDVDIHDRRVARIIAALQELPGQELFTYLDEAGETRRVTSEDVNAYLREVAGAEFTAKDFRTWAGTVLAATSLAALGPVAGEREAKRNISRTIETVAARLGNTPAVCRKCYVHPAVLDAYVEGDLPPRLGQPMPRRRAGNERLWAAEARVLRFLERRVAAPHRRAA
jgi:DNA topoisomerase-1